MKLLAGATRYSGYYSPLRVHVLGVYYPYRRRLKHKFHEREDHVYVRALQTPRAMFRPIKDEKRARPTRRTSAEQLRELSRSTSNSIPGWRSPPTFNGPRKCIMRASLSRSPSFPFCGALRPPVCIDKRSISRRAAALHLHRHTRARAL